MIVRVVTIRNKMGIHARPASLFVQTVSKYKSDVFISKNGNEVNGKSIMGVISLEGSCGSQMTLRVKGEDEKATMNDLVDLIERRKFDEE
jgi:phosphocarrier protein HPr